MKKGVILTSLLIFFLMSVTASEGFLTDSDAFPEEHSFSNSQYPTIPEKESTHVLYEDTEEMEGRSRVQSAIIIAFVNNKLFKPLISGNIRFSFTADIPESFLIFPQPLRAPPCIAYSII